MIERLALVIHWVGFLCLLLAVFYGVILQSLTDTEFYSLLLTAVAAWPIKFILTGNKAIFPWQTKYSWTLQKGIHASENEDQVMKKLLVLIVIRILLIVAAANS